MIDRHLTANALSQITGKDRGFITRRLLEANLEPVEVKKQKNGELRKYLSTEALPAIYALDASDLDPNAELARLRKEQADKTEMENSKLRGDLIPADDVEAAWSVAANVVRQRLLAMPKTLSRHLAGKDEREIETEIESEIRSALDEIADTRH